MASHRKPKRVIVASNNPVKRQAVEQAFSRMLPETAFICIPAASDSGVPSQPIGDAQTQRGADHRVDDVMRRFPAADFWVGIEGGVDDSPEGMYAFAWVVIRSNTSCGRSRSASFLLPEAVAHQVRAGLELGAADDAIFGVTDSKRSNGAVGLLSGNVITRTGLYEHAIVMALIPFVQPQLYPPTSSRT